MRRRPVVLRAVALALAAISVVSRVDLAAQAETSRARRGQTPPQRERTTRDGDILIPFTIGPRECVDRGRLYTVSMQIHNVLAQPVGQPTLAAAAEPPPSGVQEPILSRLRLPCGRYLARWSGRHLTTGRRMPPGIYLTELVIDGLRISRKVTLDQ